METNKQPLEYEILIKKINKYNETVRDFDKFQLRGKEYKLFGDAMNDFADAQTKPLLEEIEKIKAEKQQLLDLLKNLNNEINTIQKAGFEYKEECLSLQEEISKLKEENADFIEIINGHKKDATDYFKLSEQLSLSKKENEELKGILKIGNKSEKIRLLQNEISRFKEGLTSVKEQLTDVKENEKNYHDKCFKLESQNKELAEAYDKLMNSYSKLLEKIQGK